MDFSGGSCRLAPHFLGNIGYFRAILRLFRGRYGRRARDLRDRRRHHGFFRAHFAAESFFGSTPSARRSWSTARTIRGHFIGGQALACVALTLTARRVYLSRSSGHISRSQARTVSR